MVIFSFTSGKHHSKKKDEKLHWWARSGQPATGLNFLWNDMGVRKTLTYYYKSIEFNSVRLFFCLEILTIALPNMNFVHF